MPSRRPALAALAALAVVAVAADAPAQQIPKNLPKVPEVVRYKATLDVAGRVSVHRSYDTKSECRPGQKWDMTNRALVDYERTVDVLVIDGKLGPIAPPVGGVAQGLATLDSYTTSNYCPPATPVELQRPDCDPAGHEGKVGVALGSLPGRGFKATLALTRIGGGAEDPDCDLGSAIDLPGGFKLSPFDRDPSSIAFGLDLRGRSFATLGRGKKLTRKMRFSGTCDDPKVTHGAAVPMAQGDCFIEGTINFSFKRRLGG